MRSVKHEVQVVADAEALSRKAAEVIADQMDASLQMKESSPYLSDPI
jgi:hypothetical protein